MFKKLKTIYKPELYHGHNKGKQDFFEGWYFKVADKKAENVFAFIPGVFQSESKNNEHAFIQVLDGRRNESFFIKYAFEKFRAAEDRFFIEIENNKFSKEEIILDIQAKEIKIKGKLNFYNLKPWPVDILSPGAMGWYGFIPFMECNHGVLSFTHQITGDLKANSEAIDFDKGKGYLEKDWGSSFPSAWLWLQSNHFNEKSSSLMVSIATIPWLSREFRGFIIGFLHKDHLYKFTTYNNANINKFQKNEDIIEINVENKGYKLFIKAYYKEGTLLKGPFRTDMVENVEESIQAIVEIKLVEKATNKIITEDKGKKAGFELNGNLEEIIDNF
ncbi:MAG TPA: tocopherol cyclase family protein [Halanaerobiales bacterium]|nr:tocopherol cyclase family protein [Halanaerobiales bacterium]